MQLIQHQELASAQSSIVFTDIPQTFTDLCLVVSARTTSTSSSAPIQFNGSSANLTKRELTGDGTNANSGTDTKIDARVVPSSATANTFSNISVYVPNYTSSVAKSVSVDSVTENNSTTAFQEIAAGLWNDTSAITSISISSGGNFVQYSSASLFGITAGSDGIVAVS